MGSPVTITPDTPVTITPDPPDTSVWGQIKAALAPRSALDEPGAKAFHGDSPLPGSTEGHGMLEGLSEYDKASGGEIGGGVYDVSNGDVAKGLHRIISGFMSAAAPAAAMTLPAVAVAAPVTTGLSIAGGVGGQKLASAVASGAGATPDQQALAGDVGGIAGGIAGPMVRNVAGRALLLGKTPAEAYQSALKPSTTIPPAKVASMVNTGLEQEIPVSKGGANKLDELLENLQEKVTQEIGGGQGKTISRAAVSQRLTPLWDKFSQQVTPAADLKAIAETGKEFAESHPSDIPAADAQAMKVGTYQQLKSKSYGELKSATIESQKALARGLKEELANAFPELGNLNAAESKLFDLQPVLDKAVQRQGNHQLMGIGTPAVGLGVKAVTGSTPLANAASIMKLVVDNPVVKSRLAIALNKAGVPYSSAVSRIQAYSGALAGAAGGASDASEDTPDGQTTPQR